MSVRDDELDDDDPMLRGMRGVWREMRDADEEPPSRGLDALMAAARVQAAAMAPEKAEPWWRRAFAMMLRPPVLAAATVIVLLGGAVALKSRGADDAALPTTESVTGDPDMGGERQQKLEVAPGAKNADAARAETITPTNEPMKDPEKGYDGAGSGQATPPPPPPPPPPVAKPKAAPERKLAAKKPEPKASKKSDESIQAPADLPARPQDGLVIAGDGDAEEKKPAPSGRSTPRAPAKPAQAEPIDAVVSNRDDGSRPQSTVEQLIRQAETAASRNDCAAVKVTAERIRKLDANVYRSRVANQPAIAKCLK